MYTFATLTPFQRPAAQAGKDVLTEEEQKALEEQLKKQQEENIATNEHFSYNALWFASDEGRPTGRTSIIIDPEDGRLPPLTERGQKLRAEMQARAATKRIGKDQLVDTWEDISTLQPLPLPRHATGHARVQPGSRRFCRRRDTSRFSMRACTMFASSQLDGRPHLDSSLRQWNGDSRGHWEGDTLVVDWTNFSDKQKSDGSAPFGGFPQGNMHVIERFRKVDANTLDYIVTVEDPTIWTRPFTFCRPVEGGRSDLPRARRPV